MHLILALMASFASAADPPKQLTETQKLEASRFENDILGEQTAIAAKRDQLRAEEQASAIRIRDKQSAYMKWMAERKAELGVDGSCILDRKQEFVKPVQAPGNQIVTIPCPPAEAKP